MLRTINGYQQAVAVAERHRCHDDVDAVTVQRVCEIYVNSRNDEHNLHVHFYLKILCASVYQLTAQSQA
jgi:hypothetical protein